jgi:hypothetical protein
MMSTEYHQKKHTGLTDEDVDEEREFMELVEGEAEVSKVSGDSDHHDVHRRPVLIISFRMLGC